MDDVDDVEDVWIDIVWLLTVVIRMDGDDACGLTRSTLWRGRRMTGSARQSLDVVWCVASRRAVGYREGVRGREGQKFCRMGGRRIFSVVFWQSFLTLFPACLLGRFLDSIFSAFKVEVNI